MVTRRAMLKGTAAGSIAAIASAHGVAASADNTAIGAGYGNLEDGALGVFQKVRDGVKMFVKFQKTAAEVHYKANTTLEGDTVDVFIKMFHKGWGAWSKEFTFPDTTLEGAAGFYRIDSDVAGLFVKLFDKAFESDVHYLEIKSSGEFAEKENGGCNSID